MESDDTADDGPQNSYRITAEGRAELDTWLHKPLDMSTSRDELVVKVLRLDADPGRRRRELTQTYRRHVIEAMHEYTRPEGGCRRGRHWPAPRGRCRDLPVGRRHPVARCRRRPHQAPSRPPPNGRLPRRRARRSRIGHGDDGGARDPQVPSPTATERPPCWRCATSTCPCGPASSWRSWARAIRQEHAADHRRDARGSHRRAGVR